MTPISRGRKRVAWGGHTVWLTREEFQVRMNRCPHGWHRPSAASLRAADPENVRRLARYLGLRIEGMSDRQIRRLIRWRTSPQRL